MQNTPAGPSTLAARARSVVLPQQLQPVRVENGRTENPSPVSAPALLHQERDDRERKQTGNKWVYGNEPTQTEIDENGRRPETSVRI
jgi:hypothetical protein